MEYSVGKVGRVVVLRLSEGDEIYQCIESVAREEKIASASVFITGGFRKADVVVGPKEEEPKIVGNFEKFVGPGEVLGVGTIFSDEEGPKMHMHAAMGKGRDVLVGCPRGGANVFLVLEVVIVEIEGTTAIRKLNEKGVSLLTIRQKAEGRSGEKANNQHSTRNVQ